MRGVRVYEDKHGFLPMSAPGSYGRDKNGTWWVNPPSSGPATGCLDDHEVEEHEDGTITVTPSIYWEGQFHGYLERGVWRDV